MSLNFPKDYTPASFNSALLGTRHYEPATGKEYCLVKNTDASSLASGYCVTLEDDDAFTVDICASTELPFGIVVNELTGAVAAVNDMLWVQTRGLVYASKGLATGSSAVTTGDNIYARGLGAIQSTSGTVGARSLEVLNTQMRFARATTTVASSATTQVRVWLYG